MEDTERIKDRLANIRGVEPIISSLRTIAAGGWRQALKRVRASAEYIDNLSAVLAGLLYRLPASSLDSPLISHDAAPAERVLLLVIASERGLCGSFNDTVLSGADRLIAQQQLQSQHVLVATLGSRAEQHFASRHRELFAAYPLPVTRVPSFELVREIGQTLIDSLVSRQVDAIHIVYSPYRAAVTLEPVSRRWLPIDRSILPVRSEGWTEPIVEGRPSVLLNRLIEDWMFVRLYQLVIESTASEQAARFRAMDAASSNLTQVIDELTLLYHSARQHAITMEMLDLVAGSGILKSPTGRS